MQAAVHQIWMGGPPPLGYDVTNKRLMVNQAEAETVRLIFRTYVEAGSMTKDLALLVGPDQSWLTTEGVLEAIDTNLGKALAG